MKKLTTIDFIKKSKEVHGDKYNYSKSVYTTAHSKIKIICKKHGEFQQEANNHMNGSNCRLCINNNIKYTKEQFIEKAKEIHGNKYDYNNINYKNCEVKVDILCKIHGIFKQRPSSHLQGYGCSKCAKNFSSKDNFIKIAKDIHNNKYDYSLVDYKNNKTKVKIICHDHGIFTQRPDNHIGLKHGCPSCGQISTNNSLTFSKDDFIKQAKKIHSNKYDYNFTIYKNNKTKVKIKCSKHGFFFQTPNKHLHGHGCPICKESVGERVIRNFLLKNKIEFISQKRFDDCKFKISLIFDFYIPNLNICIEFDGLQHFEINEFFGGIKSFDELKIKDEIKNKYCRNNNIKLIRLKNIKTIENILNKKIIL